MRSWHWILPLLVSSSSTEAGLLGRKAKRHKEQAEGSTSPSGRSALSVVADLLNLWTPPYVYHMDREDSREQLISMLWTGEYTSAAGRFTSCNSQLVSLFEELQFDDSGVSADVRQKQTIWPRFEGVLAVLFRARSQKIVSLETAALSVMFHHYRVPTTAWNAVAQFTRVVMSPTWTEVLCNDAASRDPGAAYKTASGMTAAVFDNFQMNVGFGSYGTQESRGHVLKMTNWATAFLPASAIPTGFNLDRMLGSGGIFRVDRALAAFVDLFSPIAPDLLANKRKRWTAYLGKVAAGGELLEKEPFTSPYPPTYFHYHDPIFDRLQSSYEDVNFELDLMRNSEYHRFADSVQLGGDGLSYMRLIHRLAQDPRRFLETKPIVIPRLGEAPHGKYHVLHGDWRLWAPLIMRMAVVTNARVKRDPCVTEFNEHEHFLRIMVEAFSEYVVEISLTGSDYRNSDQFLQAAEANLSFAFICYFLYLFWFKYVQMRTAVRRNDSALLDMIWRENLATARTSLANKKNYSQMTIAVIYWGWALVEPLQTIFHNTRTLRWLRTHVGWDFIIEMLNCWIKAGVVAHITESQIQKFIHSLNFTHVVVRGLEAILHSSRAEVNERLKPIKTDKDLIKDFLRQRIGTTFAVATAPSNVNLLQLDLADWGGQMGSRRENTPWEQMRRSMQNYRSYVQKNVAKLCPWHHWSDH